MNGWDILIIGVIAAIAAAAVFVIVKRKKRGGCSAGCDKCGMRNSECGMKKPSTNDTRSKRRK